MLTAESFSRLLILLYEGASTPERLSEFLQEAAGAVGADAADFRDHLFEGGRSTSRHASLFVSIGYSQEALRAYTDHFHTKDVLVQRILERSRSADCGLHQALITEDELRRTEIYSDYTTVFDIGAVMWGKLVDEPHHIAGISFTRSMSRPFFDADGLQVLSSLMPHMRQALKLSRMLRNLEDSNSMLESGLDEARIAICMVRQDGSVLRSTPGMERLFAAQNGIQLFNRRLKVAAVSEQRALDTLITGACQTSASLTVKSIVRVESRAAGNMQVRGWTPPAGGSMLVTRKPPLRPLQLVVTPFRAGSLMREPEAAALIQFSDPFAIPRSRAHVLEELYQLTPTESRLADLLLKGCEVREAADSLTTTVETTRFYLKRILAKTGTHRQTELMRLMLSLPGQ
jgi:DNA-binding CsgD family transcriptional regulator